MEKGIIVAGSMIFDNLKKIDIYPGACNLTKIRKNEMAMGGLVNNCVQDFAHLDSELPLKVIGLMGDDAGGNFILNNLKKYPNIDLSGLKTSGETSFTDVMYDSERRTRAYFQFEGSNADLGIDDFDFDSIKGDIIHVGYLLLLNKLDEPNPVYGTNMGELLHKAQSYGIKTSIDVVSEESDRYQSVVAPALKYVDYCIINEMEAGKIVGIPSADEEGRIIEENMPRICKALRNLGVRDWIIVHARDASYGLDVDGTFIRMDCIDIPRSMIVGTTGAGDAFCTGALYGAYKGMSLKEAMYFATGVASTSLFSPSASESVTDVAGVYKLMSEYPVPDCMTYKI
ncbi:MAG: carbohydrate kinase family protein [Clostridia bacterium]|nr:carbohydrate kinase family protein [Clostridia bacterium]